MVISDLVIVVEREAIGRDNAGAGEQHAAIREARLSVEISTSAGKSRFISDNEVEPVNSVRPFAADLEVDPRGRRRRVRAARGRTALARRHRRTPSPAGGRADSRPRCRASSCRCRRCNRGSVRRAKSAARVLAQERSSARHARKRTLPPDPTTRHGAALKNSSGRSA